MYKIDMSLLRCHDLTMSMTLAPTLAWDESPTLGSRPCMRDERSELSYEQVRARVDALAEQLVDKGVAHGDIVAIMLPNCVELLVGILAAWRYRDADQPGLHRQRSAISDRGFGRGAADRRPGADWL